MKKKKLPLGFLKQIFISTSLKTVFSKGGHSDAMFKKDKILRFLAG